MLKKLMKAYLLFVVYFSLMLFILACIDMLDGTLSEACIGCISFFIALYIIGIVVIGFLYLLIKIGFFDDDFDDDDF